MFKNTPFNKEKAKVIDLINMPPYINMVKITRKKGFHELLPITSERAESLDKSFLSSAKRFEGTNYIIGGGWSIAFMLKTYYDFVKNKYDVQSADKKLREWVPAHIKYLVDKYYRNHNKRLHLLCTEDQLPDIVSRAKEFKMRLYQRVSEGTLWPGRVIENYIETNPEEITKKRRQERREFLSSKALRLVRFMGTITYYQDLFVHHLTDKYGNEIVEKEGKSLVRIVDGKKMNSREIMVVSNKDVRIAVPFADYLPITYNIPEKKVSIRIANPYYMAKVKEVSLKKGNAKERDSVDFQILKGLLRFIEFEPLEEQLEKMNLSSSRL